MTTSGAPKELSPAASTRLFNCKLLKNPRQVYRITIPVPGGENPPEAITHNKVTYKYVKHWRLASQWMAAYTYRTPKKRCEK